MKPGVIIAVNRMAALKHAIYELEHVQVLVGAQATSRSDSHLTNAEVGYIHEHGAPEMNIPARPHLGPGIEQAQSGIKGQLEAGMRAALAGRSPNTYLGKAGSIAVASVKAYIQEGLSPPLKAITVQRRKKKGVTHVLPLISSGQYLNALTWFIRNI